MNKTKEIWIAGFALFSLFFGAGNLILPPSLGAKAGLDWWFVVLGFALTAVTIPILAIFAHAKLQGTLYDFGKKVSPIFSTVYCFLIYVIAIAIPSPRTAAVTHEITVQPFFETSPLLTSIIYFVLVFIFALNRSSVIGLIGKFLTPFIVLILLLIITISIFASSGTIKIDDQDISGIYSGKKAEMMSKIGYLFQAGALFDSLTIWQNISFILTNCEGVSNKKAREVAIEKLALVGLEERVADLYPNELSGGMQKRAALARAIAGEPEIIFFDEPTTGLDPIMSDVVNDLIVDNSKRLGATTITITHDMASAKKIADKIAMLHEGKIIWFGDKKDMYKSGNDYMDRFINGIGHDKPVDRGFISNVFGKK